MSSTKNHHPPYPLITYSCRHSSADRPSPVQIPTKATTALDHPCYDCAKAHCTLATQRLRSHYAAQIEALEAQLKAASQRLNNQVWSNGPINEFLFEAIEEKKGELKSLRDREKNMVTGVWEGFKAVWEGLEE